MLAFIFQEYVHYTHLQTAYLCILQMLLDTPSYDLVDPSTVGVIKICSGILATEVSVLSIHLYMSRKNTFCVLMYLVGDLDLTEWTGNYCSTRPKTLQIKLSRYISCVLSENKNAFLCDHVKFISKM